MAARSHVDSGVNERRLRPIYDCLDNGNNKKALQEAEKLLKKQKDFLCAKALKALALVRLGKSDEAFSLIREVHNEDPTDDPTLQAMTICYRELQKLELIADAYERATRKDPHNEELLSHLFMSHVRNGDYKKQQQVAMALYKLKPKNPYYFWAVMSIVMQATNADKKLAKTMLLPLAERMTEKFVKENKLEAEAEVQLYLMILEKQEKFDKALEVLEGPLQEKLSPYQDTLQQRIAEFLVKLEKWSEANQAYQKLILGNPDQWSFYLEYFKSLEHLVDMNYQPEENSPQTSEVHYNFDQAIGFIEALVAEQDGARDGRKLRGPYLAQIKLLNELLTRKNLLSEKIGTMVDVLARFYEHFGTKPSCFVDLSYVIKTISLEKEDIKLVLQKINESLMLENSTENITLPNNLKQMNRHLCLSRLSHFYGAYEDWSTHQLFQYCCQLIERYYNALQFGSQLLSTEFQPADSYCLLAAHMLISIWEKTGDERFIAQVLVLLEQSLKNSPSNYQIKILLMKIYNTIGAVGASFTLYDSIDVKHAQQETLGYLITDPLSSAAFYTASCTVLGNSIRFYTTNYKDIVDYLLSGYKFGSFTKIPELVEFREKVNNSLQYATVTVERMVLDILLETRSFQDSERIVSGMEIDPEKDHRTTDDLVDSRDVFIYRMHTEKEKDSIDDQIKMSCQEKMWWFQLRNIVLRILAASMYLHTPRHVENAENNITNGEKRHMPNILSELLTSLKDCAACIDQTKLINTFFPIQSVGISRLSKYLQDSHLDIIEGFSKLVLNIHGLVEGYATKSSENKEELEVETTVRNYYQSSLKRIQEMHLKRESFVPTHVKLFLEDLANTIETLSFSTIFISICYEMLKPFRSLLTKKGKKKKENISHIAPETFQQITNLINDMTSFGNSLQDLLNELAPAQLASLLSVLSVNEKENFVKNPDIVQEITNKVQDSYSTSIKELKCLLSVKVKYLHSLKW
ncbi:hypothetical protein JTE90_027337 [Oedothorax gibbosus]|uniref:N-terminal acetyltransferase B complex subunit MDM20 homolog n=1 Tax=Oedothorax gibbosus TaxID=931172 RepID=A0AAV6W2M0_9ARAC|nr:hypothetical protein JTE90_027337 [Oedothorax gibbosus]